MMQLTQVSLFFVALALSAACATTAYRSTARPRTSVRLVGGPTAVIELGGARFLTDPTFSPPGAYPVAPGRTLTKLEGPAVEDVGDIDAVLLSHDQHVDNLDPAGRAYVARAHRRRSARRRRRSGSKAT